MSDEWNEGYSQGNAVAWDEAKEELAEKDAEIERLRDEGRTLRLLLADLRDAFAAIERRPSN